MKILEQYSALSPIYQNGLTNHLPMMVVALRLLDVSEEDVATIVEQYVDERGIFVIGDKNTPYSKFDEDYVIKTNHYLDLINKTNIDEQVKEFLSTRQKAIGSGLFHGLLRLSYAYMTYLPLQVAQALAYFDLIAGDLFVIGEEVEVDDIGKRFTSLAEYRSKAVSFSKSSTTFKVNKLLKEDFIRGNLFYPKDIYRHKGKVLDFLATEYLKSNDFYMLHAITGFQALQVLEQFFDKKDEVYQQFFMNAILYMLIYNHKRYKTFEMEMDFFDLYKKTQLLRDAHDIKLFFSLSFLYERYENDKLKKLATRIFKTNNLF